MKKKSLSSVRLLTGFIVSIIFLSWIFSETSCTNTKNEAKASKDTIRHLLNWNVFFGTTTQNASRADIRKSIEDSLRAYAYRKDPTVAVDFKWSTCPCDTLLTNLNATLVGGSGEAIISPPTQPQPGASGDYIVRNNMIIEIPEASREHKFDSGKKIYLTGISANGKAIPDGHVIALIDTGLDTSVFQPSIRNLLWRETSGPTLFNFLKPDGLGDLSDSNRVKHGTAATALAMQELKNPPKPKIMALKAFDKNGKGTIYSVSCALSYAIKNRVSVINASWGYYGEPDSVLHYYIKRADSLSIPIIAAAGNSPDPHQPEPICNNNVNEQNKLRDPHLFYPACFSTTFHNLISVTGLSENSSTHQFVPCYYQNYSGDFVSVGVLNKTNCCAYNLDFLPGAIEGTSFATPVVSGQYLLKLQTLGPGTRTAGNVVDMFSNKKPGLMETHNGTYIEYAH
jgi:hypothetical protein